CCIARQICEGCICCI
uniref:Alpha-conotoxin-like Sm3.2 n=1 Tax=Conus stercusmuscarum TaxID=89452 RepID=CM32_CONSE|nr:RecName: Full=Alpha-conotoxin-like Sm3.2 [Conus stercusmuscarum]